MVPPVHCSIKSRGVKFWKQLRRTATPPTHKPRRGPTRGTRVSRLWVLISPYAHTRARVPLRNILLCYCTSARASIRCRIWWLGAVTAPDYPLKGSWKMYFPRAYSGKTPPRRRGRPLTAAGTAPPPYDWRTSRAPVFSRRSLPRGGRARAPTITPHVLYRFERAYARVHRVCVAVWLSKNLRAGTFFSDLKQYAYYV